LTSEDFKALYEAAVDIVKKGLVSHKYEHLLAEWIKIPHPRLVTAFCASNNAKDLQRFVTVLGLPQEEPEPEHEEVKMEKSLLPEEAPEEPPEEMPAKEEEQESATRDLQLPVSAEPEQMEKDDEPADEPVGMPALHAVLTFLLFFVVFCLGIAALATKAWYVGDPIMRGTLYRTTETTSLLRHYTSVKACKVGTTNCQWYDQDVSLKALKDMPCGSCQKYARQVPCVEGFFDLPGYLMYTVKNCDYASEMYKASLCCLIFGIIGLIICFVTMALVLLSLSGALGTSLAPLMGASVATTLMLLLAVVLWAAMFPHSDMEGSAGYSFYMMLIAVVLCLPATAIVIWNSQQAGKAAATASHKKLPN